MNNKIFNNAFFVPRAFEWMETIEIKLPWLKKNVGEGSEVGEVCLVKP